jgi:hypothetical protein
MELLLPLVAIVDMTLKMSLGSKALTTIRVWALVVFCMVALMMFKLVCLVKDLMTARLVTRIYAILWRQIVGAVTR